jgi:hypothetical protein
MVEFQTTHKEEREPRITSNYKSTKIDWYDEEGEWGVVDIRDLDTQELWTLRNTIKKFFDEQLKVIDDELNNWTPIHCAVCGKEDLAHRGYPFVTWGIRSEHILCPKHVAAFDREGTPDGEQLKQLKQEQREIKELFG